MGEEGELIIVYPSEIHQYVYCPRQYFFRIHYPLPVPLLRRLRMLLGRIYHALKRLRDSARGYIAEDTVEARMGGVLLRGRPDAYRIGEDRVEVVERKSGRGPRRGVWLSDMLQAAAYGYVLYTKTGGRRVLLTVEYRSGARTAELTSERLALLAKAIDEIVMVKVYGIVPYANRSPARCSKCPYRSLCEALDRELDPGDGSLYEPGKWVAERKIDWGFQ